MSLTAHQASYYGHELTRRGTSNSVEKLAAALTDAQVNLNPHEVEEALFACQNPLAQLVQQINVQQLFVVTWELV